MSLSPANGDAGAIAVERTHIVQVESLSPHFSGKLGELPALEIAVRNQGASELFLSPDKISVFSAGQPVRLYSYIELSTRIQKELQQESEEYSGRQAEVFLQSDATRQDPSGALAAITSAKRANKAAANRETRQRQIDEIKGMLVSVGVPPGETGGGIVKLRAEDIRPGKPLRVAVQLDGETYEFVFEVGPGK